MKLKSFRVYIHAKSLFQKASLRARFIILNLCFLFTFLLSFQNCGQKLSSNLNTNIDLSQGQQSTVTVPVAGQCSTQLNSCLVGQFIDTTDSSSEYKWLCQGLNSQSAVSCGLAITRTNPPAVNAVNGQCSSVLNQCYTGTFSDVTDTETQNKWSCLGSGGGTTASCNINKPTVIVTPPLTPVNLSLIHI